MRHAEAHVQQHSSHWALVAWGARLFFVVGSWAMWNIFSCILGLPLPTTCQEHKHGLRHCRMSSGRCTTVLAPENHQGCFQKDTGRVTGLPGGWQPLAPLRELPRCPSPGVRTCSRSPRSLSAQGPRCSRCVDDTSMRYLLVTVRLSFPQRVWISGSEHRRLTPHSSSEAHCHRRPRKRRPLDLHTHAH